MKKRRVALILQGGGAFGAYECGAIKALYEQADCRLSCGSDSHSSGETLIQIKRSLGLRQ